MLVGEVGGMELSSLLVRVVEGTELLCWLE